MPNSRYYSSTAAVTNLQVTATPAATSFQVASSSGWPGTFPFIVSLDYGAANEELVLVTSGGPNIFNCTRAYDGTSSSTHNAGAIVRHVSSAIDFTDSRTHEASTTGVHGITGSFVDTDSAQTLINKTLTNPTINGAALAGNFTGNPVFTGTPTFNNASGSPLFLRVNPTDLAWRVAVSGDANNRLAAQANGALLWSDGTLGADTNLYRSAANTLKTDDNLDVGGQIQQTGAAISTVVETSRVTGDTQPRFGRAADGSIGWGPGNAAFDTTMGRSAAGVVTINDSLATDTVTADTVTATTVNATNFSFTGQTWTTFTPTWNTVGSATFSTNYGEYTKYGKLVYFRIYSVCATAGSGTSGVSVMLPTEPFRNTNSTRQVVGSIFFDGLSTNGANWPDADCQGQAVVFAGDSGNTTGTLRNYRGAGLIGNQLEIGSIITIQGSYREV